MTLQLYAYQARDEGGRAFHGSMKARSRESALASLRGRSLYVTSLRVRAIQSGPLAQAFAAPISAQVHAAFFRALATMLCAGIALHRAIVVCTEQCSHPGLAEALRSLASEIEAGLSLGAAMANRPQEFSPLHVAMIRAGEIGGHLDEGMRRLADLLERRNALRRQVLGALAYPCVVAVCACGLMVYLVGFVIPSFRVMYAQMHVPLPAITAGMLAVGEALHRLFTPWNAAIAAVASVAVAGHLLPRLSTGRAILGLPIVGPLIRKIAAACVAQSVGTMLQAGVDLLLAIEVTAGLVPRGAFRDNLAAIGAEVAAGHPLSRSLTACGLYDPLFVQLVRAGEETGSLDSMLLQLARSYEADVESILSGLASLLEPLLILLLGAAVAFIVAAIFIPLYTLIGNIK